MDCYFSIPFIYILACIVSVSYLIFNYHSLEKYQEVKSRDAINAYTFRRNRESERIVAHQPFYNLYKIFAVNHSYYIMAFKEYTFAWWRTYSLLTKLLVVISCVVISPVAYLLGVVVAFVKTIAYYCCVGVIIVHQKLGKN